MKELNIDLVKDFVSNHIIDFHDSRLKAINDMKLKELLKKKNPYLLRAKNINKAADLVKDLIEATLYASEEKSFGNFLENLAIFISEHTSNGKKSSTTGIDLEFTRDDIYYVVSVKSGTSWGNGSQHKKQIQDFNTAAKVLKQSMRIKSVQPVLGICYGKTRTSFLNGYVKVVGQNFWYLISGSKDVYTDIIIPLGHRAKEYSDYFLLQKDKTTNKLTQEFMADFLDTDGSIDWEKIVQFNSKNFDLDKFNL
jgi:hypothetical protein